MNKIEDTYKSIAVEYINNGFNNIVDIYYRYHPKAKIKTDAAPYRLLGNARFKKIKDELLNEIMSNKETQAKECLNQLKYLALNAKKENDKINAATSFLKFVVGEKVEQTLITTQSEQDEIKGIRHRLLTPTEN